jgi:hypothetical protein
VATCPDCALVWAVGNGRGINQLGKETPCSCQY